MLKITVKTLSSLFIAILFINIGYGMLMSFIGVYLKDLSVSSTMIGIINASFFIGAALSSLVSSNLISKVGHIRSFAAFSGILIGSFLLHSLIFNEYLWIILRVLSGFSYFSLLMILESWLNEKSDEKSRGTILSIYTIFFYLANAIGQLILTYSISMEKEIFILGSILMIVPIVIVSFTKVKQPTIEYVEKFSLPKIYSIVPLAFTASFISGLFMGGFFTMAPVYVIEKFESIEYVSIFISITIIGGLISQYPIGKLSDKIGRRKVISLMGFISAGTSALFLIIDLNVTMIYLLGFFLGLTIFAIYPLAVARANDVTNENSNVVEISRVLLFSIGVGLFVAPFIVGFAMEFHDESLFILFTIIGLFLGFYSLTKKRVSDDDLSTYVNVPVSSSELYHLETNDDKEIQNKKERS